MRRKFGQTLRHFRTEANRSLGELARALGVSVPYLSDVERGHRPPLTTGNIVKAARFLKMDPQPLLEAATEWSDHVEIDLTTNSSPKARETGVSLARAWGNLREEDFKIIDEVTSKRNKLYRVSDDPDSSAAYLDDSRLKVKEGPYLCLSSNAGIRQIVE